MNVTQEKARREQLMGQPLIDLIAIRDHYGLPPMDPKLNSSIVDRIIEHERDMDFTERVVPAAETVVAVDPGNPNIGAMLLQRYVGADGGPEWFMGPSDSARNSRTAAVAFAASLKSLAMEMEEAGKKAIRDAPERSDMDLANNYHPNTTYINAEFAEEPERGSNPYHINTTSGWFIYEVVLPEFLRHFFRKNNEYRNNHRTGLGLRAEYVGLHRKVKKLEAAVWEGEELEFEQPKELLWDIMGSCLLMLDLMHEAGMEGPEGDPEEDDDLMMPDPTHYRGNR